MKKFSKLLAVLVALAVIICPMTSAIVANATANGGSYSIVAEDANNVVLTIGSNDGFIVYQATVTFNNDSAFQSSYSSEGYTKGLKVIDYSLVSGSKDSYNAPAISAQQNGSSLVILVSATDAATLDLYSEVQIGIRVASGSTANLAKIQAADEGTIEEDPSLLNFGAKVAADGTVDTNNNENATTGTTHEHNYTKDKPYVVSAPTCTAYGVYRKTCETCGAVDPSGTYTGTVMADHTPSNVQNATADFLASAATCTEPASYYYECTVCHAAIEEDMAGYTGTFTSGSALGHDMTMHSANAATCTTAGNTQYYSCDRCGKFFSDAAGNTEIAANFWNIAATGHTPVTDAAVAATCTSTGLTEGSHCSVCGATIVAQETVAIDPTNHTNIVEDAAVAPTCVATGKTAGSHCADCGAVIVAQDTVAATGVHTWGEYVSNNDATCTVDGTKTATCTVCGVATNTITDTGSAKGHSFTSYTYNNDATCTAAGTETASCDNGCGTTDTRTSAEHPATGHTPVTDAAVAATCTSTGLTEGSHCSVCSAVLVAQTETPIDPTNHTNIVEDAAVAATCTETGLTAGSHCAACDTVIVAQETVNALGHNYTYTDHGDGTHDIGCTRCDYAANEACVDANDDGYCDLCNAQLACEHNYVGVVTTQPTKNAAGVMTYTCSLCGDSYTEPIAIPTLQTGKTFFAADALIVAEAVASKITINAKGVKDLGFDNYYLVVDYQAYESYDLTTASITYLPSDKTGGTANAPSFIFDKMPMYGLTLQYTATIYMIKDGVVTGYASGSTQTIVDVANASSAKNTSNAALLKAYADMVAYGAAVQSTFAVSNPTKDIASAALPTATYNYNGYATDVSTISTPYSSLSSGTKVDPSTSFVVAAPSVIVDAANNIKFNIKYAGSDESLFVTRVYYTDGYGNNVSVDYTTDNGLVYVKDVTGGKQYTATFVKSALYDLEKTITCDLVYNNEVVYRYQYKLGTFVNAKLTDASLGNTVKAMGAFYESTKAVLFANIEYDAS